MSDWTGLAICLCIFALGIPLKRIADSIERLSKEKKSELDSLSDKK